MANLFSAVERLEARIAPAVLVNATTLTFTDADGDFVTLAISKGTLTAADFWFDGPVDFGGRQQLRLVDFAGDLDKVGANLTITAEPEGGGNGAVNVGYINALGIDLGKVTLDGDLGRFDAGDVDLSTPAAKRLDAGSIGVAGLDTQQTDGSLISNLAGPLGALVVGGDFQNATLLAAGIGRIDIGGDVIGGGLFQSGAIRALGGIGPVHVGGDLAGGNGVRSGQIFAAGHRRGGDRRLDRRRRGAEVRPAR